MPAPNLRALRAQLESIRNSTDAALAMMEEKEQRNVGPCEHKDLKDISSFGVKRFFCKDCAEIVEDPVPIVYPEARLDRAKERLADRGVSPDYSAFGRLEPRAKLAFASVLERMAEGD